MEVSLVLPLCREEAMLSFSLFQDQIQVSSVLPLCREQGSSGIALFFQEEIQVSSSPQKGKDLVSLVSILEKRKLSIALFFQDQIQVSSVLPLCREKEAQHPLFSITMEGHWSLGFDLGRRERAELLFQDQIQVTSVLPLFREKIKSKCPVSFHCVEKRKLSIALFFQDQIQVSSVLPLCREKEAQHRSLLPRSNPSVQCPSIVSRKGSSASLSSSKMKSK